MNQTRTYKLPQWEKTDRIVMSDFNDQAAKIEAALVSHDASLASLTSGKADKSTTASLQTQIDARATASALSGAVSSLQTQINGKVGLAVGKYKGNDENKQTISLGFQPKAVIVLRADGHVSNGSQGYAGIAAPGMPGTRNGATFLEVISGGFIAGKGEEGGSWGTFLNDARYEYHYIAFR